MINKMYHPVDLASLASKTVSSNEKRKYYRFRPSRFYGGIATADCVGCCLRCVFCWSWRQTSEPAKFGEFYGPEEAAARLTAIARKKMLTFLRISGGEATLHREHLLRLLALIPQNYLFILETNGIPIGADESYAKELARFRHLDVRVSLKGTCGEEFSRLTGAVPEGFEMQLGALEYLVKHRANVHPACMVSFSPPENIASLRKRLKGIHRSFEDFEVEELILYPHVEERLRKLGIEYGTAYRPDNIPAEQI